MFLDGYVRCQFAWECPVYVESLQGKAGQLRRASTATLKDSRAELVSQLRVLT
jgi:hypothetical protein